MTSWEESQRACEEWSRQKLPWSYMRRIRRVGKHMRELVGSPGLCLDVGCGCGLLGGRPVGESGYRYIENSHVGRDYVIGVDPLKGEAVIPWCDAVCQVMLEQYAIDWTQRNVFDTVVLASVLDHVENWRLCLSICHGLLRAGGRLVMYFTEASADEAHTERLTAWSVVKELERLGFYRNIPTECKVWSRWKHHPERNSYLVYIVAVKK